MRALSLFITLTLCANAAETGSITGNVHLATTNQPVAHAIVYLGAGNGRAVTNPGPAVLEIADGVFQPHVQIAIRGATLVLRNNDPALHVVRVEVLNSTNVPVSVLTQAMPYAGFQKAFALDGFRDSTLLRITGANGEEEMSAYLAVLPHPWAALTDEKGQFVLNTIPAGSYRLFVWHEVLGTLTRDVRVAGGRAATVDLAFTSTAPKQAD
jgi:hypothetical protein